jgi:hypothetical protein
MAFALSPGHARAAERVVISLPGRPLDGGGGPTPAELNPPQGGSVMAGAVPSGPIVNPERRPVNGRPPCMAVPRGGVGSALETTATRARPTRRRSCPRRYRFEPSGPPTGATRLYGRDTTGAPLRCATSQAGGVNGWVLNGTERPRGVSARTPPPERALPGAPNPSQTPRPPAAGTRNPRAVRLRPPTHRDRAR